MLNKGYKLEGPKLTSLILDSSDLTRRIKYLAFCGQKLLVEVYLVDPGKNAGKTFSRHIANLVKIHILVTEQL